MKTAEEWFNLVWFSPEVIRKIQADAIRSAAKLPPFESGRFIQVQDVIALAESVEKGES